MSESLTKQPFSIPGICVDVHGHTMATYFLQGRQEMADLTEILGIGQTGMVVEKNPQSLLQMLADIGPWRYTFFQAYAEARHRLESAETAFDVWRSGKYLEAEHILQSEKETAVRMKVRSVSEQVSKASIEARMMTDHAEEWSSWQASLEACRHLERSMEGLYRAVDKRGGELSTVISNMGILLRHP